MNLEYIQFLPWIPLLGAVLCLICCIKPQWRKLAGGICVVSIAIPFIMSLLIYAQVQAMEGVGEVVTFFRWIHVGDFTADFAYYIDTLTIVMLFVVTGIGSLVALYATGYMSGDRGYARFFAAVALFIFAMTSMVMGSNLVMLYLGWEMVGLASYLLIGYYYHKPSAVEAAKKAFIVNRIGDLGFAMGILTIYMTFGSIHYADFIPAAQALVGQVDPATLTDSALASYENALAASDFAVMAAPLLLLLGALGKSAQIPFYVWLPDAMEGPSPVSALIHAATMVTSGVYMVVRLLPLFEYSPYALPAVATIGGITAIFAATIALCQNDIKKIFAYSTVSQLGYMFLGVGVLAPVAGMWHLISHAFFKGLLFLTAGSVMHAMAGQLDIRKMSGLRHKMPVTCWLMFAACLALAGFPLTSGFFSKDMIIAYTLDWGRAADEPASAWYFTLGILALVTAFITASYGFRAWFRVFWGPEKWEMGEEDHGAPEPESPDHGDENHSHGDDHGHHHEPHEMPWWPMNAPLVILAIGALFGGLIGMGFTGAHSYGWIGEMVYNSTGRPTGSVPEGRPLLGMDPHFAMFIISGAIAISAIVLAWYLHVKNREAVTKLAGATRPIVTLLANKYYVDEIYDLLIRRPLRSLGYVFYLVDQLLINGVVFGLAWIPRLFGLALRPAQSGKLQGYGLGMATGIAVIAFVVFWAMAG